MVIACDYIAKPSLYSTALSYAHAHATQRNASQMRCVVLFGSSQLPRTQLASSNFLSSWSSRDGRGSITTKPWFKSLERQIVIEFHTPVGWANTPVFAVSHSKLVAKHSKDSLIHIMDLLCARAHDTFSFQVTPYSCPKLKK